MALNVLAVNPTYPGKRETIYVPLGLSYVVAVIEKAGHRVKVIDLHNLRLSPKIVDDELRKERYDLCIMGGFAMQVAQMREITRSVHQISPHTKVILGGVGVSDIPEIVLNYTGADAVAIGECEAVLPEMLASVEAGAAFEGVPTFVYRENGHIIKNPKGPIVEDLDTLPYPAFHHFDIDLISERSYNGEGYKSIHLMTSRGCPFRCSFCINSVLNDNKFLQQLHGEVVEERKSARQRFRSPENVVREIDFMHSTYGIEDFHFADEEFITDRKRVFELCDALRPLGITWSTSGRADWANEEKLHAMRSAGCRYVLYGVETGSQEMMNMMQKSAKKENVVSGIKSARNVGLNFIANFMVGHPGETEKTINDTIEFCRENELVFLPSYTTLFPNSKMFHEFAPKIRDWSEYFEDLAKIDFTRKLFINLTEMGDGELNRLRNWAVSLTLAYHLVGKNRTFLAKVMALFLRTGLVVMDHSPGWLRWTVRNFVRRVVDFRGADARSIQIPSNEWGQGVLTPNNTASLEDGHAESLKLLAEQDNLHSAGSR